MRDSGDAPCARTDTVAGPTAMIVAPFWSNRQFVGSYRVERFVRWLSTDGIRAVLVTAGETEYVKTMPWGYEVSVVDPFSSAFMRVRRTWSRAVAHFDRSHCPVKELDDRNSESASKRRLKNLALSASQMLLSPDPGVLWGRRILNHPSVLRLGRQVRFVLASGPPESAYLSAGALAERFGAEFIVDMRDGWLDEPLKANLLQFAVARWREGRLEARILRQARRILVTSELWKEMLERRLPLVRGKVTVLTNAYRPDCRGEGAAMRRARTSACVRLLHLGRFEASRHTQSAAHLLAPLLEGMRGAASPPKGEITLLGGLRRRELDALNIWQREFQSIGWTLQAMPAVPRERTTEYLDAADGLLLLSACHAPIPSKLFDYLPTKKPILNVGLEGNAVWRVCERLPQVFSADCRRPESAARVVQRFMEACSGDVAYECIVPESYTEEHLRDVFRSVLAELSALPIPVDAVHF